MASAASVPFVGLWLNAPESVLIGRAAQRRHDPSDADADVVRMQIREGTGPIGWHWIDASSAAARVLRRATHYVRAQLDGVTNLIGA